MFVPLNLTRPRVDDVPAKPTAGAKNGPTLELTHQRVDDVPLLLGFLIKLRIPEIVDRQFPPHPLHQGLSNGWLITVWLAYILSRADHRKSPVQQWVEPSSTPWRRSSANRFGPSTSAMIASPWS